MRVRFRPIPRLSRGRFWTLALTVWLIFFLVREVLPVDRLPMASVVWSSACLLALGSLTVARLHDRNRSGLWLLMAAIPVIGALWLGVEAALRRGTPDTNRYGHDPLRP